MQQFQITNNGLTVSIQIADQEGHQFSFVQNSIEYVFEIKSFLSDYKGRGVTVSYSKTLKDLDGNILNTFALDYTESNPLRYAGLYALNSFLEAAGDFYGKQCVNGVMERNVGWKAFDSTGALIDYAVGG